MLLRLPVDAPIRTGQGPRHYRVVGSGSCLLLTIKSRCGFPARGDLGPGAHRNWRGWLIALFLRAAGGRASHPSPSGHSVAGGG